MFRYKAKLPVVLRIGGCIYNTKVVFSEGILVTRHQQLICHILGAILEIGDAAGRCCDEVHCSLGRYSI